MRTFLAGVAGLLAALLLPIALLVAWVSGVGTDTDQFVAKMRPLVSTPQVQRALTDRVVAEVQAQLKLPAATATQIDQPLRELVAEAVARPEVAQAWTLGIRKVHAEFVSLMEGESTAKVDARGRVVMPLVIAIPEAADTLRPLGITDSRVLSPSIGVPLFAADDLAPAQRAYALGSIAGPLAPWVVVGLALLAIALARRRIRALGWVGVGGVVAAVVLAAIVVISRRPATDAIADPTGRALVGAAYDLAEDGLMAQARAALVVSVVLVLLAILMGVLRRWRPAHG